jgi:hypothetical protein
MTGPSKKVSIHLRIPNRASTNGDGVPSIFRRGHESLRLLVDAFDYAQELDRNVWDFAVEIDGLREAGFTNAELRWLICCGFTKHAPELTVTGEPTRVFRHTNGRPGLTFSRKTCFVLTEAGYAFAKGALSKVSANGKPEHRASETNGSGTNGESESDGTKPKWDRDRQELRVGVIVVKQFKVPAANQERILAAFEEDGWPIHIDDPLPQSPEQDPKRRLHDTINSLNRNQKAPLIRFLGDGTGQGVRWRLAEPTGNGGNGKRRPKRRT